MLSALPFEELPLYIYRDSVIDNLKAKNITSFNQYGLAVDGDRIYIPFNGKYFLKVRESSPNVIFTSITIINPLITTTSSITISSSTTPTPTIIITKGFGEASITFSPPIPENETITINLA